MILHSRKTRSQMNDPYASFQQTQPLEENWLGPRAQGSTKTDKKHPNILRWQGLRTPQAPLAPLQETLNHTIQSASQQSSSLIRPYECHLFEKRLWLCCETDARLPFSLQDLLAQRPPQAPDQEHILGLMRSVWEALTVLHIQGLAYGILHPATLLPDHPTFSGTRELSLLWVGAGEWMEQLGARPAALLLYEPADDTQENILTQTQDTYAFGVLLWYLLAGEAPPQEAPFTQEGQLPWPWPHGQEPHWDLPILELFHQCLHPSSADEDLIHSLLRSSPQLSISRLESSMNRTLPLSLKAEQPNTAAQLQKGWEMNGTETLPYNFRLEEELHELAKEAFGGGFGPLERGTLSQETSLSQVEPVEPLLGWQRGGSLSGLELPEVIPEQWEQEALKQDQLLDHKAPAAWLLLLLFLCVCLLLWFVFGGRFLP